MKPVMKSRELPLNSRIRVHGHAEVVVPRGFPRATASPREEHSRGGDKQAPDLQAIMFSHADTIPTQPPSPQDVREDSRPTRRT
jgi:hypothetical protein